MPARTYLEAAVLAGIMLAGRYRLDSVLGAGAMGEVWRAFDTRLAREVAIKIFPSHLDPEPRRVERFRAEAKLCGQLQHPGVVVVHDADEDNGRLFYVMELLPGRDLAKVMKEHRDGLSIERVLTIGARLAEALAAAHGRKVIHRDVKPANIMLLPGNRPKICDFGIARVVEEGTATAQAGTPAYTAPEQSDGAPDERSDLYSLGCVLYEMATGERPFHGNNPLQLLFQHAMSEPRPPREIRPAIPLPLNDLILQLLAKSPGERPQSATEVADWLRAMRPPVTEPAPKKQEPRQPVKTAPLRETAADGSLMIEVGRDHKDAPVTLDLREAPHLLVVGNRGLVDPIRSTVASLALRHSPKQLRLVMAIRDNPFADLPHLVRQSVGEPLTWAVAEVDCRYADLRKRQCRTIEQFNRVVRDSSHPTPTGALGDATLAHPDVVVVIDELAEVDDLGQVVELAREGRSAGFHLLVRTAKPSMLGGRLRGYLPTRLVLPVTTVEESMCILDRPGAESLRSGKALLMPGRGREPYEIKLAAIADGEISEIIDYWQG